jgi:hypothetical protein
MNYSRPTLRLVLVLTVGLALPVPIAAGAKAQTQSPWPNSPPDAGGAPALSPSDRPAAGPPASSPFDRPAGGAAVSPFERPQQSQEPPCVKAFTPLRDDTAKKAKALQDASARKAAASEACGLFNAFVAAETKMMKYAETNASSCGIPPQAIEELKKGHAQAVQIRAKVCQAAKMQQQQPAGPSLGDALGASQVPSVTNVKPGRGTFDTLTGTPLGGK